MEVVNKVKTEKKKFIFKDFSKLCEVSDGVTVEPNGISEGYGVSETGLECAENPKAIYSVGGKIYAYYDGGKLNELMYSGQLQVCDLGYYVPTVKQIMHKGKQYALFLGVKNYGYLLDGMGGKEAVSLPTTEFFEVLDGRLFGVNNATLYFTKPFSYEQNSMVFEVDGTMSFSPDSGKIVGLSVKDRKLYIFCKNAIYKLSVCADSIDFKLEKLPIKNIDVVSGSVLDVYEKTIFLSGDKIYAFNQDKIKQLIGLPKNLNLSKSGVAVKAQSAYILPITTADNQNKYYIYDVEKDSYCLFDCDGGAVCDGGYFCDSDKTIKRIDVLGQKSKLGVYKSNSIDMDVVNDKSLLSVCAFVSADCKLKISGDSGRRMVSLKKGYNKKRLNLLSKQFVFEINQIGQGFSLSDFYLEYTVRGE